MPQCAPLALVTLLAASAVQSDPASDYARDYPGLYSPVAQCLGQEFIVSLDPESVGLGETTCQIASIKSLPDAALDIRLNQCRSEGEPSPDRQVTLSFANADPTQPLNLTMGFDGATTWQLQRCTDL